MKASQKIQQLHALAQNWQQQPRDERGRWAKGASSRLKALQHLSSLKSAPIKGTKKSVKKQRPSFEELVETGFKERMQDYKENGSYRYIMTAKGQYDRIAEEHGIEAAEQAFAEEMLKLAKSTAKEEMKQWEIEDEREAISKGRSKQAKTELAAFDRLRPDLRYTSTLDDFKQQNPGEIKKLVERYHKEVALDHALSYDQVMQRGRERSTKLEEEIDATSNDSKKLKAMRDFLNELKKQGMSQQEASQLVDTIKIDDSIRRKIPESIEVLKNAASDFYQLTNGMGKSRLTQFTCSDYRACANNRESSINVGILAKPRTIFHEMGHTIEFEDRRIAAAAREWRDRRATGKKTKINELVSNGSYRDDEVALPDSFIHPYVGKVYPDGDTEVVSMSIQHFYSPSEALNFYQQDLDHFHFIVGILTASKEVVSRK